MIRITMPLVGKEMLKKNGVNEEYVYRGTLEFHENPRVTGSSEYVYLNLFVKYRGAAENLYVSIEKNAFLGFVSELKTCCINRRHAKLDIEDLGKAGNLGDFSSDCILLYIIFNPIYDGTELKYIYVWPYFDQLKHPLGWEYPAWNVFIEEPNSFLKQLEVDEKNI